MKTIVISPTYNEKKNINDLINQIVDVDPSLDILIIDDNSPDGTGNIVKDLQKDNPNINLIQREGKLGLGTAYCTGFKWAIENGYDRIIQMDADLSHDPKEIPNLLSALDEHDLVIGSRYITGVNVVNWPLRRLILSYAANLYASIITGLPIKDATGGFKGFNCSVLKAFNLDNIHSEGYSFQIEVNFLSWIKGFSIIEIPIIFTDRTVGESKMSKKIIIEAVWMVPKLLLKRVFRLL